MALNIACTTTSNGVDFRFYKRNRKSDHTKPLVGRQLLTVNQFGSIWVIPLVKQGLMHIEIPFNENWRFIGMSTHQIVRTAEKLIANDPSTSVKVILVPAPCYREDGITYNALEWEMRNKVKNMRYFFQ